jgi:hypothetical protein
MKRKKKMFTELLIFGGLDAFALVQFFVFVVIADIASVALVVDKQAVADTLDFEIPSQKKKIFLFSYYD